MKTIALHCSAAGHQRKSDSEAIRILTAVPICDGHDSAISTINLELVRHGIEVVYLGYHRSARDIVRAAIQEDVRAVGISSYNGGHIEFFAEVRALLRHHGAGNIGLFGGGGGTITPADFRQMQRRGVQRVFFAGTPLSGIVEFVKHQYASRLRRTGFGARPRRGGTDLLLARSLTLAQSAFGRRHTRQFANHQSARANHVIGIAGPGGVGKTTLIDELALRFLSARPKGRLAILSHDPSLAGHGALLGDRASMVYSQDDRVFIRSLATRGAAGGVSSATRGCLEILRDAGFDLVLVETTGIGQQDAPFARRLVDKQVLVLSPDYGGRLQLQKIAMLELADLVVVNKADFAGARTATAEISQRLDHNARGQRLLTTVAKRHRDSGVDQLFREVMT